MWRICEAMIWETNSSKTQEKAKSCKTYLNYKMISKVSGRYSRLDKSLTEEGRFNYILTVIDHIVNIHGDIH